MASYRRKAFGKSTQEYIDKAKMGGYVGMIYMYDELTHEYLTGWSGLSVDVNCQTLIISLLQKLVSAKQFRADQDLDDPNEVSFSINPDTKEHEAAAKHNTNKPDATLTVPDSISNKSKTSNQSTPNPRKRLRSADKDEDNTQVTYFNADDGTETDRDIKPDIMAIPVQAGYSATPTMSLSGLEPIAAASNTPDNQNDQTYDGESESVIKGIPKSPVPLREPTSPASNSPVRRRVRLLTSSSTEQSPPGSPILPSPPPTDNHQPPPASRNSSAASVEQHSRYDQMRSGTVSVKTEPSSDCVTLEILHTNTASIEKQLLKLTSMVQHLSACSSHSVGYGTYGTGVLPYFNSAEEVVLYEVADEEERKSLVLRLASIGGLNLQKGVVNMLTQLMSVEAMTSLNMLGGGTRGKRGFKNTALYQVVLESLIQYFKVSEAEVYTKVQGFLKNAEGTRKKAAARANNEHWIQPGDNP